MVVKIKVEILIVLQRVIMCVRWYVMLYVWGCVEVCGLDYYETIEGLMGMFVGNGGECVGVVSGCCVCEWVLD